MSEEKSDSPLSYKQKSPAAETSSPETGTHYLESDSTRSDKHEDSTMDYCGKLEIKTLEDQNKTDENKSKTELEFSERFQITLLKDSLNNTPLLSSERPRNLNIPVHETKQEKQKSNFPMSPLSPSLKRKALGLESTSECKLSRISLSSNSSENIQVPKEEGSPAKKSKIQADSQTCSVSSTEADDDSVFKVPVVPQRRSKSLSPIKAKRMIIEHRRSSSECTEIHRYVGFLRGRPEKQEIVKSIPLSTLSPLKRKVLESDLEAPSVTSIEHSSLSANSNENIPLPEHQASPSKKFKTQPDLQLCPALSNITDDNSAFKVPRIPPRRYKSLSPMKAKRMIVERRRSVSESSEMARYRQHPSETPEKQDDVKSNYSSSPIKRKLLDLGLESASEGKELNISNRRLSSSESLPEPEESPTKKIRFQTDSLASSEPSNKVEDKSVFKVPIVPPRRYKSLSPMKAKRMIVEHRRSASENPEMRRHRHLRRTFPEMLSDKQLSGSSEVYGRRRNFSGSPKNKCSRCTDKSSRKHRRSRSARRGPKEGRCSKSVGRSVGVPPITRPTDPQYTMRIILNSINFTSPLQSISQANNPHPSSNPSDVTTETRMNYPEEQPLEETNSQTISSCLPGTSNSANTDPKMMQKSSKEPKDSSLSGQKWKEILCQEQVVTSSTIDPIVKPVESNEDSETDEDQTEKFQAKREEL